MPRNPLEYQNKVPKLDFHFSGDRYFNIRGKGLPKSQELPRVPTNVNEFSGQQVADQLRLLCPPGRQVRSPTISAVQPNLANLGLFS